MNWKYAVLTRIIFLGVFMSSCASNSGGQNANHLDNKGITCDATGLGDDRFVMCGRVENTRSVHPVARRKMGSWRLENSGVRTLRPMQWAMVCMILGGKK
ncbi:MAG: hypothetical protein IPP06_14330 [Saprospiraceae bacterium]|nr:hypothetical protein [Candidatus Vicinibacter affinis]